jgi:uncharacterized protein YcfJ
MVLGKTLPMAARVGSIFSFSRRPSGDLISRRARMRLAISSREPESGSRAEGELHAAVGAELIDEDAGTGVGFDVFEEEGGAAGGYFGAAGEAGFRDTVGDLGDFEQG